MSYMQEGSGENVICAGSSELSMFDNAIYLSMVLDGGSRISGMVVHMYKCVGVRFADFISFFLNIP